MESYRFQVIKDNDMVDTIQIPVGGALSKYIKEYNKYYKQLHL